MITIDTRSREPIYRQIEKQIIKLISLGIYESDAPLPSVRAMACDLGVNPNTVARAYKSLEQQEIIYTIVGKGVFVGNTNTNKINSLMLKNLKQNLNEAKALGVEKQDIIDIVDAVWRGNSND